MSSQSLIHPSKLIKDEWVQFNQSIAADGLVVQHHVEPPDEIENTGSSHHFLCLYLDGWQGNQRQVTRCEGQEFDGVQKRGDIWLVPAERSAHWYWEGTGEGIFFVIDPVFLSQIAAETGVRGDRVELLSKVYAHDPNLLSMAVSFQQEMQQPQWGNRLYLESLTNLFCIHLLRNYCAHQPKLRDYETGLSPHQLQQVRNFVQAHLDRDIQLADLAQTINVSSYYFIRLFKQSTGITPYQYLLQQRIRRAKELLMQQRKMAIADIALQCGFADQSHFTAQFRKAIGMTPKQFRENL